jgi:hypothetical protein
MLACIRTCEIILQKSVNGWNILVKSLVFVFFAENGRQVDGEEKVPC